MRALAHALAPTFDAEIVVADWHSTDWPLAHWIHVMASPVPVRVIPVEGDFSLGVGFNVAADNAESDRLLFLGGDMLVSAALLADGHRHLDEGTVYFPLVWSYTNPEQTAGEDRPYGRGNIFMTTAMRKQIGRWPEFKSQGKFDDAMWNWAHATEFPVKCEQRHDFFHQWHPNDAEWKNQNYGSGWREDSQEKLDRYRARTLFEKAGHDG